MAATSLLTIIGAISIHLTAVSGSGIQSLNTCSCLGQTVSFECVVTGGTLTMWSGTAFTACSNGEIILRHSNFVGRIGSCNDGAINGRGVTSDGNQYTSRLDVMMTTVLVGRTVTCSVDDNQLGSVTLAVNTTNTLSPPRISVANIGPDELIFSWDTVPPDGCPSFQYNISAMNCGTCIPSLTTSNMSTCTNFSRESYPNTTNTCNFRANSIICGNINGSVSSPIHVNLTVPGVPSVRSVAYYNYRTSILEEIQTSFNALGSFRISDSPVIDGDADNYTVTYADTTTGSTCYSDTIMASSCKDGTCQHSYFFSDSSCRQMANITVTVFATNVLGHGRMSTPINISGENTFVSVTFNASTRTVLCNFSKTSPSESHNQCIVNVTYGAECDQLLGTYTGTGTESSNVIASPPFDLISGVSEYCISVNATSDNETVIVEERVNIFQVETGDLNANNNNAGYIAGVVVVVLIMITVIIAVVAISIFFVKRRLRRDGFEATHTRIINDMSREYYKQRKETVQHLKRTHDFVPSCSIKDFHSKHRDFVEGTKAEAVRLIGRVDVKGEDPENNQPFLEINNIEGTLTINTNKEHLKQNGLETLWNKIGKGDLLGVSGFPMTNNGELCMDLQIIVLISPCLHRIAQSSEKLDPIVDDSVAKKFLVRIQMISLIRKFLIKEGFLEVETPMVNVVAVEAAAEQIVTGYTDLNHKMLILKGFDRVYEIGKHFNKKKFDHIDDPDPEFTTCEICCAFTDYNKLMSLTESMISEVVDTLTGKNNFDYHYDENDRVEVDFKTPFRRISVKTELEKQLAMELKFPLPKKTLDDVCSKNNIHCSEPRTIAKMLKELIEHLIVKQCDNPTFITDYPQVMCPFAKEHDDVKGFTEHFELVICKQRICHGYTDLIEPEKLKKLLQQQEETGDYESYCKVLDYGLPPCAGWGMEIDRMAMLLTDSVSLEEVIIFPPFKPVKKTPLKDMSFKITTPQHCKQSSF